MQLGEKAVDTKYNKEVVVDQTILDASKRIKDRWVSNVQASKTTFIVMDEMTDEELRAIADEQGIPKTVTKRETLLKKLTTNQC